MSFNVEQTTGLNLVHAIGATNGAALTGLSGAASTYSTSAIAMIIDGKCYNKAAVSGGTTPTTDGNSALAADLALAVNQARAYVWCVNSGGTVKVCGGPVKRWSNSSGTSTGEPVVLHFPAIPSGYIPFAAHYVGIGSNGSAFTFGSTNWNTTGVNVGTVQNLAGNLPSAPLTI